MTPVRSGHVIIYVRQDGTMKTGLVTTVWKAGKKKKIVVTPCSLTGCHAFRAVELTQNQDLLYDCVRLFMVFYF